jgi:RNA polymerase sigma factor (sigma-70 family)
LTVASASVVVLCFACQARPARAGCARPRRALGSPAVSCEDIWQVLIGLRRELIGYAHLLGMAEDAPDVVHEAMIRVIRSTGIDLARVRPLTYAVLRNLAVDVHRQRSRTVALGEFDMASAGPEDHVCERAEAWWYWEQARRLSNMERTVLLAKAAGANHRTIAARLGMSEKAVECAVRRARKKLQRIGSPATRRYPPTAAP